MADTPKVSDITVEDLADYCRIDETDDATKKFLEDGLAQAISYIKNWTGQTDLDQFPEFVGVVKVLVQDMYDTRSLYVEKSDLNKMVQSILGLHSVNLL